LRAKDGVERNPIPTFLLRSGPRRFFPVANGISFWVDPGGADQLIDRMRL
jgi:hypothetical protein